MRFLHLLSILSLPVAFTLPTAGSGGELDPHINTLEKRGPNFGGDCWVLRKPNGSTSYSNRYLGPGSHFRVGCMKAEREIRRKEAEEKRKKLRLEWEISPLTDAQRACFDIVSDLEDTVKVEVQKPILDKEEGDKTINDRWAFMERENAIRECRKSRDFDERSMFKNNGPGFSTKRLCKGDIGRLDLIQQCLIKLGVPKQSVN